jgi:adenylate cyclase
LRENEIEENHSSHRLLGYIYHALGRDGEAVTALERAVQLDQEDFEARGALAFVYRAIGNPSAGETQYKVAWEMAEKDDEYGQACFHAVSGNVEKALELLEVSCAKDQTQPGWIRIDPEFVFIQNEPRFQALVN